MDLFSTDHHLYQELCKEAQWHNYLYFVKQAPVIEDSAYDALIEKIRRLEEQHPDWILPDSPTQKVGEVTSSSFESVEHKRPMLSLDKVFTFEQIEKFDKRLRLEVANPRYCVEYKIDGLALSIWYERGRLVRALTRGDGVRGDDVTANVLAINQLPLQLQDSSLEFVELRAEVYMSYEAFQKLNQIREAEGLDLMVNPRNAAAGSLKLLDPKEVQKRGLSIAVYSAQSLNHQIGSLEESWAFIHKERLPSIDHHLITSSLDEITHFIEEAQSKRSKLNYGIDGIVIKLSDYAQSQRLGATGQYYRWGIAYKFSPEQALSHLLNIELQVGRTGVVTPVALLTPVFLDGSLISRCSLYNSAEIERKDVRIGDWVYIVKGGDIIPKIVSVDLSRRPADLLAWKMPEICPECSAPLVREEGEVAWRCSDEYGCPAQCVRRLVYFAGKDGLDIENLGERTVEQLFEKGLVREPADFFKLTVEQLLQLDGFAQLSATKLLQSLEARRKIALERFLGALNIKHLGSSLAHALAKGFGSLKELQMASYEDLLLRDGIGPKVAATIVAAFQPNHPIALQVQALLLAGVEPLNSEAPQFKEHPFQGKIFVLTGSLERFTRADASRLIRERGGDISSSVSRKTDFLLAGSEAGSKLEKAHALGIKVLTEELFLELL